MRFSSILLLLLFFACNPRIPINKTEELNKIYLKLLIVAIKLFVTNNR